MTTLRNAVGAVFVAGALATAVTAQSPAATAQDPQGQITGDPAMPETDLRFVQVADMSSSTEILAGKLAMSSSQDDDVKTFARTMIDDHMRLASELKAALPASFKIPQNDPDHAVLESLRPLRGKQFDDAYIAKVGLQGHREAIAAFQREANGGQVAQIREAARTALPTIKHHYRMAQELARKKGVPQ
jgi:putative membrane protein